MKCSAVVLMSELDGLDLSERGKFFRERGVPIDDNGKPIGVDGITWDVCYLASWEEKSTETLDG